jgi:type IV pilus assembly protein PilW
MPRLHPPRLLRGPRRFAARGLTLVEMMVAMAIGMVLVVGLSTVFVNSSVARNEIELSADVIENGQYALVALSRELAQTGFYGTLVTPAGGNVDPCSTDTAVWATSLTTYAVGLNNNDADPACLARKPGTDAIFIQRASTCTTTEAGVGCAEEAGQAYLQVSECGMEYSLIPYVIARANDPALALQTKACDGTRAPMRRMVRRFYYVSPANVLSSVDITPAGVAAPVALVENIEQLQIEYAVDVDGDGTPDAFSATPADWTLVIGARLWLLARSSTISRNGSAALTFQMSDTRFDVPETTLNFKRRVYSTFVSFLSPKSRRES